MNVFTRREPAVPNGRNGDGAKLPEIVRRSLENSSRPPVGAETFAPRRHRTDASLAALETALVPAMSAPPAPLSEEARKLVSQTSIRRAETMRDSMRATVAARLAEHDAYMLERLRELKEWDEHHRANLTEWADRIYRWGDEHVAQVTAEMEEQARRHHRDVTIYNAQEALLEQHGVPLPPVRPAEPPSENNPTSAENHAPAPDTDIA